MQTLVFSIFNTQPLHNPHRNCWLEKLLATVENPQSFKQEKDYYSTKPLAVLLTGKLSVNVTCQSVEVTWALGNILPTSGKASWGKGCTAASAGRRKHCTLRQGVGWSAWSSGWADLRAEEIQFTTPFPGLPFTAFVSCLRVRSPTSRSFLSSISGPSCSF